MHLIEQIGGPCIEAAAVAHTLNSRSRQALLFVREAYKDVAAEASMEDMNQSKERVGDVVTDLYNLKVHWGTLRVNAGLLTVEYADTEGYQAILAFKEVSVSLLVYSHNLTEAR